MCFIFNHEGKSHISILSIGTPHVTPASKRPPLSGMEKSMQLVRILNGELELNHNAIEFLRVNIKKHAKIISLFGKTRTVKSTTANMLSMCLYYPP